MSQNGLLVIGGILYVSSNILLLMCMAIIIGGILRMNLPDWMWWSVVGSGMIHVTGDKIIGSFVKICSDED